jgi:amino acid adenylation domain-containing protein
MKDLILQLKRNDIHIKLTNDKLVVKVPKEQKNKALLGEIRTNKDALINYLKSRQKHYVAIKSISSNNGYELSSAQLRLWILSQFENGSLGYNIPMRIPLNQLQLEAFKQAIKTVTERHEILRTVFRADTASTVKQWIIEKERFEVNIPVIDYSRHTNVEYLIDQYIKEDAYQPFDLENGPLWRVALLKVSEHDYVFYYNMHHIISDGWSMNILTRDIFAYYEFFKSKTPLNLPTLSIQYKDYAAWQLEELSTEALQKAKTYWNNIFSSLSPTLTLPGSKPRPTFRSQNGFKFKTIIANDIHEKLINFHKENGGSLFISLLSIWYVLLNKYTQQKDITVGVPVSSRDHPDLEDQIGFYINTIALRIQITTEDDFLNFYKHVQANNTKAYDHQTYPFDRLIEDLGQEHHPERNPLFDVFIGLQEHRITNKKILTDDNNITSEGTCKSRFDLELSFHKNASELSLHVVFNTDIYEEELIKQLSVHYTQLANALLSYPLKKINQIDYLNEIEKHQLLTDFNGIQTTFNKGETIIDLFEDQVLKYKHKVALVFKEKQLTYLQLNEKANQLAHFLENEYFVKREEPIVIELERNEWMIISILAIMKVGGAYVPIDPHYPEERKKYIIKDTNSQVIINKFLIDHFNSIQHHYSTKNLNKKCKPSDLAYIIYTSGSTGFPKGVLIEHLNVVSLFKHNSSLFDFSSSDVWTLFHSFCFDFSVWEMYGSLLFGGRLVIVPESVTKDAMSFKDLLINEGVTVLNQTPSSFYALQETFLTSAIFNTSIRYVIFGGESLNPSYLSRWNESYPNCKLINMYGITETTVHVTYKEITQVDISQSISNIGSAIPSLSCYILNEQLNLVPKGVIGEICISGSGVARGYLNREELTKEKFITNPFKEGILYKSGDLGRWLPDGTLEYVGRKDNQVKLRGYRIELGELENALIQYEQVEQAVVDLRKINGEPELVGYFTSQEEILSKTLRSFLKKTLPIYMIPQHYIRLQQIPLTGNGKVNKKELPDINGEQIRQTPYVAPVGSIQEKLVEIWEELLKKDQIGVDDDFFQLGGHSLKMIILSNKIKQHFNCTIKVNSLYQTPTINEMSQLVKFFSNTNQKKNIENTKKIII